MLSDVLPDCPQVEHPANQNLGETTRHHLLAVARCPVFGKTVAGASTSCSNIVDFQRSRSDQWQVPTPWVGRLDSAPILFVSANPSIGFNEDYPNLEASDDELVDAFHYAFEGDTPQIKDGIRQLRSDGSYSNSVRNWAEIRSRARELLQREPQPGIDYAMTEAVRCRSQSEKGVSEAMSTCTSLYFQETLRLSPAQVIVLLGKSAQRAFDTVYTLPTEALVGPTDLEDTQRMVVRIPHSNARQPRTLTKVLDPQELQLLRGFAQRASRPK